MNIEKLRKIVKGTQIKNAPIVKPMINNKVLINNADKISDCIDIIQHRELRNQEIYIICELAKRYLEFIKEEER